MTTSASTAQSKTYTSRDVLSLADTITRIFELPYTLPNGDVVMVRTCKEPNGKGDTFRFLEVVYGVKNAEESDADGKPSHSFSDGEYFTYTDAALAASAFVFRVNDPSPRIPSGLGKGRHVIVGSLLNESTLYRARHELMSAVQSTKTGTDEGMKRTAELNEIISRIIAVEKRDASAAPAMDVEALVRAELKSGTQISAVKLFRSKVGCSLTEAAHAVQRIKDQAAK